MTYETHTNPITRSLKDLLLEKYNIDLLYIYHPYLELGKIYRKSSEYEYFKDNKFFEKKSAHEWHFLPPILYIKDLIYTLIWCLKFRKKWDLYFAAGNLNPLVGIFLKKLGMVKKVVYYSMDYYPKRFENNVLNYIYYELDKFCVKFSDETWNTSSQMVKAREKKMGMKGKDYNRQYTVPGGIWFYKAKRLPIEKIDKNKIVYRGSLLPHMGVELAIKAIPNILKKIPNARLEILGGGPEEKKLKNLAKELNVSTKVKFRGWIKDRQELEKLISDGVIGLATFNTDVLDEKVKNADPGKIKDYMVMGLPVITTKALFYYKKIEEKKCGIVIDYDPSQLAWAVIKLLSNEKLLRDYRKNALKFIEPFDWNNIFKPNLERILK